jgi:hypothetical protein
MAIHTERKFSYTLTIQIHLNIFVSKDRKFRGFDILLF